jgi:hypothetical protein
MLATPCFSSSEYNDSEKIAVINIIDLLQMRSIQILGIAISQNPGRASFYPHSLNKKTRHRRPGF